MLGSKYRRYSGLGGSTKIKLECRDNLSVEEVHELLSSSFGVQVALEDMKNAGYLDNVCKEMVHGK